MKEANKMKKIVFIRHGKTEGNTKKRYIGRTDEGLCNIGENEIKERINKKLYPNANIVAISPMKRCIETASLIYKNKKFLVIDKFRECDFGDFENKNYQELQHNEDYLDWIESNGTIPFPNGDNIEEFKIRCVEGFIELMNITEEENSIALVIHGGTIMAILCELCNVNKTYYEWMTSNGNGYICIWNGETLEFVKALE